MSARFKNAIFGVDGVLGLASGWMDQRRKALAAGNELEALQSLLMAISAMESAELALAAARQAAKKGGSR
jgi:hypothetical protein